MPAQRSGITKNDETDGLLLASIENVNVDTTPLPIVKTISSEGVSLLTPLMGRADQANSSGSDIKTVEVIGVDSDKLQPKDLVSSGDSVVVQPSTSLIGSLSSALQGTQTIYLRGPGVGGSLDSFAGGTKTIVVQSPSNSGGLGTDSGHQTIRVDTGSVRANQMQTAVVEVPSSNDKVGIKRQLSSGSSTNPIVTKVIITKNPTTSQPQAVPVQMAQVQQGQPVSLQSLGGINVMPHVQSPTKTVTITSQGIVSPMKTVLATLPGSPTKVIPVNKVPISPAKTPTKITMIPVSIAKSPQRLMTVSASGTVMARTFTDLASTHTTSTTSAAKPATITMSPSKLIIKQGNGKTNVLAQSVSTKSHPQLAPAQPVFRPMQIRGASNVQQIQVPGSKFHYVRLVSPASQTSTTTVSKPSTTVTQVIQTGRPIAPATLTTASQPSTSQVKITLPVQSTQLVAKSGVSAGSQNVQRILLPAPNTVNTVRTATNQNLSQLRHSVQVSTQGGVTALPSGATILSAGGNIQGLQGFALVPATYVTQIQKQMQQSNQSSQPQQQQQQQQQQQTIQMAPQQSQQTQQRDYIPIASSDPSVSASVLARNSLNGTTTLEATGARPRKPCNCTKSQCLKLYCDCFANGEFCHNCNCTNCANNLEHEEERSRAIKSCLDRNPMAFHPKIGKTSKVDGDRRHNKGCNCKRSGCLKNYCECYEAKIMCSSICKCVGCKNFEESPERKTLMHLADAAEVRVQQQTAAKTKLSSQMSGLPSKPPLSSASGERLPYTLITTEVAEATCACLLAQAEEAERMKMPPVVQERMVIEEFGRCLMQIIESANKTRAAQESLP